MEAPKLPWLVPSVFAFTLVVLILDAGGGAGWGTASAHVVLAARFDHVAASPLYDLLAGAVTTLVPAGEPGFRLGVLGALLGACTLAGVVAAARALLPRDPLAGLAGAALLLLAPPVREAAAFAGPSLLAACGLVWAVTLALRFDGEQHRDAVGALAACALVIGSAPWLGALVTIAIGIWLARAGARRDLLALVVGALGITLVALWFDASGTLPGIAPQLGAGLLAAGRGAAAIVIGAGLVGLGFGALTGLPRTRPLLALAALATVHELVVGGAAPALLALCALGIAIIPSAIVRVASPSLAGLARHALALGAALPLVGVAAATGATFTIDDPGSEPRELAHDLIDAIPPGTGIFVTTRAPRWLAIHHEMIVAGARPDLGLVPPLPPTDADAIVANALRANQVVGADAASFGRLDVTRATPRYRGFQLLGDPPETPPATVLPPARYTSAVGAEQAVLLALERARYEAANGRLDAAARAAGLEARFGAADLAILGATVPSRERPALFGLLPAELMRDVEPWLLELFGDDLAWVAGIAIAPLPETAPTARKLHAKWRAILAGAATPDDPEITALGPAAVQATREIFVANDAAGSAAPTTNEAAPTTNEEAPTTNEAAPTTNTGSDSPTTDEN